MLVVLLTISLATSCGACRKRTDTNTNSNLVETSAPFAAREPAQYRATRITTYTNAEGVALPPEQTGISRDGASSRIDLDRDGGSVTVLETPAGRFLVANDRKVFAKLQPDEPAAPPPSDDAPLAPDLAPERLLNQSNVQTEYRRLRVDQFGGRAVTVYQVTARAGDDQTDSLIWVDDETGFPLKTETSESAAGVKQAATMVTEIHDLALGPLPPGWFDVPSGYREIPSSEFWKAN